jgi:hypothetical protein
MQGNEKGKQTDWKEKSDCVSQNNCTVTLAGNWHTNTATAPALPTYLNIL